MATAAIVTLDLRSGDVRTPRPVIRRRCAATSGRHRRRCSTPAAPAARRPGRATIAEGQRTCAPARRRLYTDGLIEHRGASIDDGITQVSATLAANAALAAGPLADVVLERAGAGGDLADDIALLVVRFTGVPA